jgi:competence protein ComEC
MHLFAISGLHIAAIALAIHTLLSLARVPPRARFAAGTALLWFYVEITGGEPSAIRAFWMVTCLLASRLLRAPSNSLSALAVSALGVLAVAPHQLFTAGFQMSYGIVAALLLYGVPLQEKWHAAWQPWANLPPESRNWRHHIAEDGVRFALAALALGLAATLVSTPATLTFFGLVSPGGFFVNLILIPVSSFVLFAGLASWIVGLLGLAPLAVLFNHAGALLLQAMEKTVVLSLEVPGASWPAQFAPPALGPASLLGVLLLLALGYALRWPRRAGGYLGPWLALALLLAFGVEAS